MIATFSVTHPSMPDMKFEWDGKSTEMWAWSEGPGAEPNGPRVVMGRVDAAVFEEKGPPTQWDMALALMLSGSIEIRKAAEMVFSKVEEPS